MKVFWRWGNWGPERWRKLPEIKISEWHAWLLNLDSMDLELLPITGMLYCFSNWVEGILVSPRELSPHTNIKDPIKNSLLVSLSLYFPPSLSLLFQDKQKDKLHHLNNWFHFFSLDRIPLTLLSKAHVVLILKYLIICL